MTSYPLTMETETAIVPEAPLEVVDRCDRCGAQAKARVRLHAGELLFCGHHYREHAEALAHAVAVPRSL